MAIDPTGPISKPLSLLRDLLASLAAVQAWLGVDGEASPATAAAARIHLFGVDAASVTRPAIVLQPNEWSAAPTASRQTVWEPSGTSLVVFEELATDGTDTGPGITDADALMHHANHIGAIVAAVQANHGGVVGGVLVIRAIDNVEPIKRMDPRYVSNERPDVVASQWQFAWGNGEGV